MKKQPLILPLLTGLALSGVVEATTLSYSFEVTATDGPLQGTSASGTFTFDSSVIPVGGGMKSASGLLSSLNFTWNGITYDQTTANTGNLFFYDTNGPLLSGLFGNDCSPSFCGYFPNTEKWWVSFSLQSPQAGSFGYTVANDPDFGFYSGTVTAAVPEPETYAMILAGLGLMGFIARRKN